MTSILDTSTNCPSLPKLAYLVLAHSDPAHLGRLLSRLDHSAHFYVHVDLKSDPEPFVRATENLPVLFIKNRVRIRWGTFSIVLATLRLISAALNSPVPWVKLVLLSGSCYPAKPIPYIYDTLLAAPDHNHIRFLCGPTSSKHMRYLSQYWLGHSLIDQRPDAKIFPSLLRRRSRQMIDGFLRFFPRDPAKHCGDTIPHFGSQFFAITRACAEYTIDFINRNQPFSRFHKYTFAPDEHFFHTIIANSPYFHLSDGCMYNLRPEEAYRDLASLHLVASNYRYFELNDLKQVACSDKLFIRKVNSSKSRALLDRIDVEILR